MTITDTYQVNGAALNDYRLDSSARSTDRISPAINWVEVPERTKKDCVTGTEPGKITCRSVNLGFFRNFETDSASQDV